MPEELVLEQALGLPRGVEGDIAARICTTCRIAGLSPMIPSKPNAASTWPLSASFWLRSITVSAARCTRLRKTTRSTGFSMKSYAPPCSAFFAVGMSPCAVTMMVSACGCSARAVASTSRPAVSVSMTRSVTTTSKCPWRSSSFAAANECTMVQTCPGLRSASAIASA